MVIVSDIFIIFGKKQIMKKTILNLGLLLLMGVTTLQSCKKGANDPFLSLKSRDSRITGTWVLKSMDYSQTQSATSNSVTVTDVTTQSYDGSLLTEVQNGNTYAASYTSEMVINKDGTYTTMSTLDGDKSEDDGYWWWLNDKKNKTRIAFDDDATSYMIEQLKNKSLVLKYDYHSKNTNSNGDASETTTSSIMTFEKSK